MIKEHSSAGQDQMIENMRNSQLINAINKTGF